MEAPVAVGHTGVLPIQGQGGRREWRKVAEGPNGRERMVGDASSNQARATAAGRPRSSNVGQGRSSRNGRMFHPGSSGHSSDSDHHGGDAGGSHLMGGPVSPQDLISQSIGQGDETSLYEEMHCVQQQSEHVSMTSLPMDSGLGTMENPDDALEQRLHDITRQREQLQQAEVELRAQFIARSEVMRIRSSYDEQSKQHSDLVASLQGEIQEREQQIHHLEQNLEQQEQQLRANQMQATEAVWAKDGLLREQTNELASLRRERDSAVTEHQAVTAQLDAERADLLAQLEQLKEQLHEKERHMQEVEEQQRTTQEILLFKEGQLQDAQAWMARAQELDAYHVNANNTLHAELRDRTDQVNQLWMGYQRQLQDMERYHAQVIQRLQLEVTEAREQNRILKGATPPDRPEIKDERQAHAGNNKELSQNEEDSGMNCAKATMANGGGSIRGNLSNGTTETALPAMVACEGPLKVEQATGHPIVTLGMAPVLPSAAMGPIHQFGLHQQVMTPAMQPSPVPVPQPSLPQLQALPSVLPPPQHLPHMHQQVIHAHQHHNSQQQQSVQGPRQGGPSSTMPMQAVQLSPAHEHAAGGQEQGAVVLLPPSSAQPHATNSSMQPSAQLGQQAPPVSEPVQPHNEEHQEQPQQAELSIQHHRQSSAPQERQGPEPMRRLEQQQQAQTQKQVHQQQLQNTEAQQLQHQQGISSTMQHLSAPSAEEGHHQQHETSGTKSVLDKQEPRTSATTAVTTFPEANSKTAEPVLLDERSLLACLVRAVPAESNSKIRISSTLPNRLGKMLAPLHWHDYRKQYGRLDEFVSSHPELFVIEGDYIHLREGAHAMVSATTAVAKAAAAAAAAAPLGPTRLPTVAVTPVAQLAQLQRGRTGKAGNKDSKSGPAHQQDQSANASKQRPPSPQSLNSGNSKQNQGSVMARNLVENGMSTVSNNGKVDPHRALTGVDTGANGVSSNKSPVGFEDTGANGYGGSGKGSGSHGNRQHGRGSLPGTGHYRKQDNQFRPQTQESRVMGTPTTAQ